jgi:enamine deaminase RidA (YjgF/YER057c/UK114 family)
VWRVSGAGPGGVSDPSSQEGLRYRHCDDFLFGATCISESQMPGRGASALAAATLTAYRQIFDLLDRTAHRHLMRIWNYLPDINGQVDGDERYRHFNAARQAAFRQSGRSTVGSVPAACALGSPTGSPLSIYFLASRQAPTVLENPRQISAYRYPAQYGTHSPTFSRACLLTDRAGTTLFVSGTASIVGHETFHPGNVRAQTRETLANIEALLEEANRLAGCARYGFETLALKAYVRRREDLIAVAQTIEATLSAPIPVLYVQADVCRSDLLVEIEAVGGS